MYKKYKSCGNSYQTNFIPIIGDRKYNNKKKYMFEKLKLNAYFLKFIMNNEYYEFKAKLPNHFNKFISKKNINKIIDKNINNFL